MNSLLIDTTSNSEAVVSLRIGKKEYKKSKKYDKNRAQIVLPLIKLLLDEEGLAFKDISSIKVNPGPGSFTGIRVGVSVANVLGFFLDVPINNLPQGQLVEPTYT